MSITKPFNKYGNLEIGGNMVKYRLPTDNHLTENTTEISRSIKRIIHEHQVGKYLIEPSSVENSGRYTFINYDLSNYSSIDGLRDLHFEDKLNYYHSLIDIGLEVEKKSLKIVWDRLNFAIDDKEESLKVMFFETEKVRVFETDNEPAFNHVRDLIVTTLTTLNEVNGRPKRIDFIYETDENSINFVQDMFKLDSLTDLRMLLDTFALDYEDDEEKKVELIEEERPKKIFFKKKEPILKSESKPKIIKEKRKKSVPKKIQSHSNSKSKKKSKLDKKTKIVIGLMVFSVLLLGINQVIFSSDASKTNANFPTHGTDKLATSTYFKDSNTQAIQKSIVRAYRLTYNQNYEDAYKTLLPVNKRDLSFSDLPMVIEVYHSQNKLAALLDEAPIQDVSNEVITYLIKEDELDELPSIAKAMETQNPYIDFETAYLENDFKKVISLIEDVDINGRKEGQIVDAYIQLNRFDDANKFAQKVGNPDLIKQIEGSNKY